LKDSATPYIFRNIYYYLYRIHAKDFKEDGMDKYYIVWDDGNDYHKIAEKHDYYDAIIEAGACYVAYHRPIAVIHNGRVIHKINA